MIEQKQYITEEEMKKAVNRLKATRQTTVLPGTAKERCQRVFPNVKIDESLFESDSMNVFRFTAEIQMQTHETIDEFIFTQIKPFCENTFQRVISKDLLVRALTEYFENHPEERELKEEGECEEDD